MPIAIHPGEHLAKELETFEMSVAELARQLKVPTASRELSMASARSLVTHGLTAGPFLGTRVLAESAKSV
jgi:plasmid maintenance system antidote protein VapI